MPVFIYQNDAMERIAKIEGDSFFAFMVNDQGNYSLNRAVDQWLENTLFGNDEIVCTIYGAGGLNRYFVYGNGEIKFSRFHASFGRYNSLKDLLDFVREVGFEVE